MPSRLRARGPVEAEHARAAGALKPLTAARPPAAASASCGSHSAFTTATHCECAGAHPNSAGACGKVQCVSTGGIIFARTPQAGNTISRRCTSPLYT